MDAVHEKVEAVAHCGEQGHGGRAVGHLTENPPRVVFNVLRRMEYETMNHILGEGPQNHAGTEQAGEVSGGLIAANCRPEQHRNERHIHEMWYDGVNAAQGLEPVASEHAARNIAI